MFSRGFREDCGNFEDWEDECSSKEHDKLNDLQKDEEIINAICLLKTKGVTIEMIELYYNTLGEKGWRKMFELENEASEIIDHVTERIDKLRFVRKELSEKHGVSDPEVTGKIIELENLRDWIASKYY